jgi:hypothetical protein
MRDISRFISIERGGLFIDRDHDYKSTVFLAGSARGGTTWLAEIVNASNEFRNIFEPFNADKVAVCSHLALRQYLRSTNDDPQYFNLAQRILSGRFRDRWSDQFNRRIFCKRRLIKEVYANLFLGWLRFHFPFMPIVYILRHPCAVAASRLNKGWDDRLGDLLAQEALVEDYLKPFLPIIAEAKTSFQRHIVVWCIENLVPLNELRRGDALVVFYEHVYLQAEVEVQRLATYIALGSVESMRHRIRKPSSQTQRKTSAIALGNDPLTAWKNQINPYMVTQAIDLVRAFGLSAVYGPGPLPLIDGESALKSTVVR